MKAILTKVIPCTNTKPTRVKAYTEGGNSIMVSWSECDAACDHDGLADGKAHLYAAYKLARKMQWPGTLLGGGTPTGYAFIFLNTPIR